MRTHTADLEAAPRERPLPNRIKDRVAAIVTRQLIDKVADEAGTQQEGRSDDVEARPRKAGHMTA